MQMSVFALSVTPYITSSIIMQLMTIVIPALEEMQKDGEDGRKRMAKITRYVTVVLAVIEGAGLAIGFANQGALGTNYTTFTIFTMIIAWRTYYREWNWKWYFHYPARKHCIRNAGRFYFSL